MDFRRLDVFFPATSLDPLPSQLHVVPNPRSLDEGCEYLVQSVQIPNQPLVAFAAFLRVLPIHPFLHENLALLDSHLREPDQPFLWEVPLNSVLLLPKPVEDLFTVENQELGANP